MFIVSGGKGTGKTRALLEKAKAEDSIIACQDPTALRERAYGYGITGLNIISYEDLHEGTFDRPIFIHDMHKFINFSFPEVKGYSVCAEK
jgi:hypothetical protein